MRELQQSLQLKAYVMLLLCLFLIMLPQRTQAKQKVKANTHTKTNTAPRSVLHNSNRSKRILQPRIIGGTDAEQGQYPYMVSIVANSGAHDCGGVLVAKDVVLTAAHCSGKLARVHVGRWNRRFQFLGDQFDDIEILKDYVHPLFEGETDSENLNYDFALLKLGSSSSYQPIRINEKFFVPNTNQAVTALGFGQTRPDDGTSEATILQQVDLKYIPNEQCSLSSDGLDSYEGLLSEAMMCAADEGKDACFGDSGGPLVARNLDSQPVDNDPSRTTDVLVGLTSWGFGCADANFPGVYARVSNQFGWLTETICQISDDPPNEYYNCPTFANDGNVPVVVKLTLDDYPSETSWQISCNNVVYGQAAQGKYGNRPGQELEEMIFVPLGATCTFKMRDEFGDGLCCDSPGSFQLYLYNDPSQVFASGGGNYGPEATYDFNIPADADAGATDSIIGDGTIPLTVSLLFDDFPEEVGWQVDRIGIDATTVYNFPQGTYRTPNGRAIQTVMLQDNQIYRFRITDFERDGMPGGTIQVLLGTMDVNERDKAILERRGGDMRDFFEVTFTSWENSNQATDPPAVGSGEAFLTIALGFDLYPQEIGWQLRVRDRSLIDFSRTEEEDGQIVAFRPIGYYSDRARETVYDQVAVPQLPPNGERDFIFIITDEHGDGMCCDWGNELVEPGYSIHEGEAVPQNLILSSKMKDTSREIKYFGLPSERKEPASTNAPTPEIVETSAVNLEISLAFSERGGSSSFYIEDAATGNRVVNYPCSPNVGTTRTYSIPSGVYTFAISNDCGKVGSVPSEMEYAVRLQGAGPNRPPLLQGTKPGTDTFVVWGEDALVETMEMSLEFTTSSDPSSFNHFIKRLDVVEDDAFLAQVAKFSLEPNRYYIQSLSIPKGGLYRVALGGVTESALVNRQVMLKIGDKSYPITFPGLRPSEEQYIKFLAGSLPSVSTDGPSLMLRIVYDNDPLDLEYVLFEETGRGSGGNTATSRAAQKMTRNRIYAFGPQNETLVSGLAGQEHIEILPLPLYAGEKTFTLLITDSGGDGLCCKQGNGGPIELFDGPIEDNKLLFEDAFSGTTRKAFTFTRQGEAIPSSSSRHAPFW
eukprot:CAMPEP_0113605620 /NCGR_PEP_ID=MMETSP0017_2-20120614/2424_1 /TAXON_ID=2856 /ORGANISM="Cylindrotheca closterium" /LENGTH=1097 /DNA_ID=CAMNT_0000514121 /DNA_START=208 /DNA_END=3498 /DNA_ORIENTATION=- /assembly_acc=CAM_ASM_000147